MADKIPLKNSEQANDIQPTEEFQTGDSLAIAHGGTSAITANAALNNLLPLQTGNSGKKLQTDGANTSWETDDDGGTKTVALDFSDNNTSYLETTSASYNIETEFIYPGSNALGTPTNIEILGGSNNATYGASWKIVDQETGLTVAEKTNFISESRVRFDMGTLSNISATATVWEIHAMRNDPSAKAQTSAIRIY